MIQYFKDKIQKSTEDSFFFILSLMLIFSMSVLILLVNFFNYFLFSSP